MHKSFGATQIIRGVDPRDREGRASRHHRPERRRQVDAVQPDQRPLPAHAGQHPAEGRGHHRLAPLRDQPARPVALFPGDEHLSTHVRVRERSLRRAVVARLPLLVLARVDGSHDVDRAQPRRCWTQINLTQRRDMPAGVLVLCRAARARDRRHDRRRRRRHPARRADRRHEPQRDRARRRAHPQRHGGQDAGDGRARHERRLRPRRPHLASSSTARSSRPARRRRSAAMPPSARPISAHAVAGDAEVRDLHAFYGKSHILQGVIFDVARARS